MIKLLLMFTVCVLHYHITDAAKQGNKIFLLQAVEQRNIEIVRWLIAEEAFVNFQDIEGKTPLMQASLIVDNTDILKELIASGADTDIKQNDGKTALHLSAEIGARDSVQIIFENSNNTHILDDQERTALHSSVISEGTDVLTYLMDKNFDHTLKDINGYTAIHIAAQLGKVQALGVFYAKGIDLNLPTTDGRSPLILSIAFGQLETAEYLINLGVDVTVQDNDDWTALHMAAYYGNLELVKLLVNNNSDLDKTNSDGDTPLHLAANVGHYSVAEYLVNAGSNLLIPDIYINTLMHEAAVSGNKDLISYFMEKNIQINDMNKKGYTPLVVAAMNCREEAVKFLVKMKADTIILEKQGLSFLKDLVTKNCPETIKAISEIEGILISDMKDGDGATLLHYVCKYSSMDMVLQVLNLFVSEYKKSKESNNPILKLGNKLGICIPCYMSVLNVKDANGRTCFHYAAEYGNTNAVDVLLTYGASQSIADKDGLTPLHIAASNGDITAIEYLALDPSNLNLVDKNGKTPLFLSAEGDHLLSVRYLIDAGADMTITDSKGWSLMHVAAAKGYKVLMKELIDIDLQKSAKLIINDIDCKSPAWYAVDNGHLDILPVLELTGVPVKSNDICYRFKNGIYDIIKNNVSRFILEDSNMSEFFSKYPCFLNIVDKRNKSPLWYAIDEMKWETVDRLDRLGAILTPNITIFQAVKNNQKSFVKYFLKKGVNANSNDDGGWPILFLASLYGDSEIVQLLLEYGANVNAVIPGWGWTPLHAAAWVGNCNTVQLLLSEGANPDVKSNYGSYGHTAHDVSKPTCKHLLV